MKSEARSVLHEVFDTLPVESHFQLVNTKMGAAMPTSYVLKKIHPIGGKNAVRLDTGDAVHVKPGTLIERT